MRWKKHWRELSGRLPVDVYPCSNGEYFPEEPTREQHAIMALAEEETERQRRRFNMTRRDFVRSAAAYTVGLWAIDSVMGSEWGDYALAHNTRTNRACDLEWPGAQMRNLPGEFIFDVQSHHVDSDGEWRATNPGFEIAFAGLWPQAGSPFGADEDPYWPGETPLRGGREVDPIENLSRFHYLKELFLDSSTNVTVLSAVPSEPRNQPLPIDEAAITIDTVRELAGGTQRAVMHAFVMPNRGWYGPAWGATGQEPLYLREELEMMEQNVLLHRNKIRGWKVYTPWGSVPYTSGWFLDGEIGLRFLQQVRELGDKYGIPKTIAAHKGFALPAFDQRAASPRDVGPAAKQFPDINFLIYHSGYDGGFSDDPQGPYPGDAKVDSSQRGVDCLIKSLRENKWDASRFVPPGLKFGNSPNVYAELGSVWRSVMRDPSQAAHTLGKLIKHVGPRRVIWGTDSLWYGSPQSEIVALRAFRMSARARELYGLPYGLDGDRFDPRRNALSGSSYMSRHPHVKNWPTDGRAHPERTIRNGIFGRNVAHVYGVNPDARIKAISCDRVQAYRDQYLVNEGTPRNRAPYATNRVYGLRTRRDVIRHVLGKPWSP